MALFIAKLAEFKVFMHINIKKIWLLLNYETLKIIISVLANVKEN
jgi:hypothetical protein